MRREAAPRVRLFPRRRFVLPYPRGENSPYCDVVVVQGHHFCTITFVLIHRRTPFGTIDLFLRHHLLLNSMISAIARVHCREDNIGRNAHRRTLVRIVLGGPCAETTAVSWVLAEPLFNDQTPAMPMSTHAQTIALREVGDANDPLPGVPGCLRAAPNRRLLPWSLVWGLRIAASSPSASSLAWGF